MATKEHIRTVVKKTVDGYSNNEVIVGADCNIYGDNNISLGRSEESDIGENSVAVGLDVIASGKYSHAEGLCLSDCDIKIYPNQSYDYNVSTLHGIFHYIEIEGLLEITIPKDTQIEITMAFRGSGFGTKTKKVKIIEAKRKTNRIEFEDTYFTDWFNPGGSDWSMYCTKVDIDTFSVNTIADGYASHAEGEGTQANGTASHAEGHLTVAKGNWSHAEGEKTYAGGFSSHAEGQETYASGDRSHAEGMNTSASGHYSHAEGMNTNAIEYYSHAEGVNTEAKGEASHAEGEGTQAIQAYSHAEGIGTKASAVGQHVTGKYNAVSTSDIFQIGCGTAQNRKNAFWVDSTGNVFTKDGKINGVTIGTSGQQGLLTKATADTYYATKGHNHDSLYAPKAHTHDEYASVSHNHNGAYDIAGTGEGIKARLRTMANITKGKDDAASIENIIYVLHDIAAAL